MISQMSSMPLSHERSLIGCHQFVNPLLIRLDKGGSLMFQRFAAAAFLASFVLFCAPMLYSQGGGNNNGNNNGNNDDNNNGNNNGDLGVQQVLLISIDGMHALDFQNCVSHGTCPNLAALGAHGVTYTRASASKPSDSFPGLMNIVSGGTPKTHGAYYDIAYDRTLAPPTIDTGNGLLHGSCTPGVSPGTSTEYEEGVDLDQTLLNGGIPGASLTDGTFRAIDPLKLIRDPAHNCAPVYPWNFVRTNTIFGVIHKGGGRTAWSDKHPVYASVSGPTGTSTPSNLDDYYSPEINSTVVGLPGVTTPPTANNPHGVSCDPIRDPGQVGSWTDSFLNIQCYDTLKVNAVRNWISGFTHLGSTRLGVPNLFG